MKNLLRNLAYAAVIVAALAFANAQLNRPALAQIPPGTIVSMTTGYQNDLYVVLSNGDVYCRQWTGNPGTSLVAAPATYLGNYFDAQPINVETTTWSRIKSTIGTPTNK